MRAIDVPVDLSTCDQIALLLEAFWENNDFSRGKLEPAYRAMTGFLLGISLRGEFENEEVLESNLCPIRIEGCQTEGIALGNWLFEAHVCFGQLGYHAMEALYQVFQFIYHRIEEEDTLRMVEDEIFTSEEWAKTGVALALQIDDFGRLEALQKACFKEARSTQDWFTLGLAMVDSWWTAVIDSQPPNKTDIVGIILAAPYHRTPVEQLCMLRMITDIKVEGFAGEWGGDLNRAVATAFIYGRNINSTNPGLFQEILAQHAACFDVTHEENLRGILDLYKKYIPSDDPLVWDAAITGAARRFINENVKIPYLPEFARSPSIFRCALDFGFWGGIISSAHEEELV